jgi:hypothetical protein
MTKHSSVKITYWAYPTSDGSFEDLDGIDDFRKELDEEFISVIRPRRGDLGGGLYELAVEIISHISLFDFLSFLAQGVAFDLIKSGTKALVLRPFLAAYRKLRERNPEKRVDIEQLVILFQDTTVTLYGIFEDSIFKHLKGIFEALVAHSPNLTLPSGERPVEIHIPVFEDPSTDRLCRFRVKLSIDEVITDINEDDYFKLWGISYDFSGFRVYDVKNKLLVDNEFYTEERYNREWNERWSRAQIKQARDSHA